MKRLIKAQDLTVEKYLSQKSPQEWFAFLLSKIGTPPSNPADDPNTERLLFNYDKIKPESFKTEAWRTGLRETFSKIPYQELSDIFLNIFESHRGDELRIEVGVANIIVFLQKPQSAPQKQKPNFMKRLFK